MGSLWVLMTPQLGVASPASEAGWSFGPVSIGHSAANLVLALAYSHTGRKAWYRLIWGSPERFLSVLVA